MDEDSFFFRYFETIGVGPIGLQSVDIVLEVVFEGLKARARGIDGIVIHMVGFWRF